MKRYSCFLAALAAVFSFLSLPVRAGDQKAGKSCGECCCPADKGADKSAKKEGCCGTDACCCKGDKAEKPADKPAGEQKPAEAPKKS